MRRILFVVGLLAALVPTAGQSASAQVAPLAPFSGYSTGTALHAGALESGATRLVDTEVAFSGANVNSSGLGAPLMNEMKQAYQLLTTAADMSAGRGSGLEVGVNTVVPNGTNANQINPGSTIQAFAPESTGLLEKHFIDVDLEPIINSDYLRGEAQAIYGPCVLGQPISFGRGYAGSADLVTSSTEAMLATNTTPGNDAVSQSRSFTYLIPNGNGKYGLVSETRQILAPITLLPGIAAVGDLPAVGAVVIEFAGEWVLRSTANGLKDATVVYGPEAASPETKVLTIKVGGAVVRTLTTQEFLGNKGLGIDVLGVGKIAIGEAPRAIGGAFGSSPVTESNGTRAAAAVDVLRITTGELAEALNIDIVDIRVGHMESEAIVPPGGIECGIPVKKVGTPTSVIAGENQIVNYTITVPSDKDAMNAVACDIMNIKVVDVTTAESGVLFEIVSASSGGKISGNTVTWDNLGTYKPGAAPIVLNVGLNVPSGSAAGKITDTATATAVLGNCKGNASADAASLTGLAKADAAALTGSDAFSGTATTVAGAAVVAPATQGPTPVGGVQTGAGGISPISSRMLPIGTALGSVALIASLAARRRRRDG